jgi:hypothetical protein
MVTRRAPALAGAVVALAVATAVAAGIAWNASATAEGLPQRLSDAEFWRIIDDFSEPDGTFRSDNLLSNELWMQAVIPELTRTAKPGRVYLGVGPEQNFTYVSALDPEMVFIVDVRRGNLQLHLMYKALFEMSTDRVDFVSRLFSRPRPDGLGTDSSAAEIFAAIAQVKPSQPLYERNLRAIADHFSFKRRHPLSDEDRSGVEYVYRAFFDFGPTIQYSSTSRYSSGAVFGGRTQPTYADLMSATDAEGVPRSYLSSDDRFEVLKALHERNMFVPIVGNFGGPRAIRQIGEYLKQKGARVSAFYLSNVEQYLRQDGLWSAFCANVAALPLDDSSMFIRSVRGGQMGARFGFGLNSQLGRMAFETKRCTPE